jgi:hypothetical protein
MKGSGRNGRRISRGAFLSAEQFERERRGRAGAWMIALFAGCITRVPEMPSANAVPVRE